MIKLGIEAPSAKLYMQTSDIPLIIFISEKAWPRT
jgi:hypothetical protein